MPISKYVQQHKCVKTGEEYSYIAQKLEIILQSKKYSNLGLILPFSYKLVCTFVLEFIWFVILVMFCTCHKLSETNILITEFVEYKNLYKFDHITIYITRWTILKIMCNAWEELVAIGNLNKHIYKNRFTLSEDVNTI